MAANAFTDLVPKQSGGAFDDLIPGQDEDKPFSGLSAAVKFFSGGGDIPINLVRTLSQFDSSPEELERLNQAIQSREQGIEGVAGDASDLWRLGGNVVATGGVGGPVASTRALGRDALERIGNVATESGFFGAMTEDPNIAEDVAIGTGISAPIEGVSALAGKLKRIPTAIAKLMPMSDEAKRADEFARSRNVPIAGEDLVQNNVIRSTARAVDAMDPTNFRNRSLERMEDAFKREVVDPFTEFDDPIFEMGEAFKRDYKAVNDKKRELYRNAWDEMNPLGPVPMDRFRDDITQMIDEQQRVLGEGSKEVRTLRQWLDYGDANIEDWATRRKKLGRDLRKAARSGDPDTVDTKVLGDIQRSLDSAIDEFGGQSNAYRTANQFFKQNIVPYREEAFLKNIKKGKIEKVVNDALSGAPTAQTQERFKQAWGALDAKGKRAYRQQLLQQIMDAAKNPETGFSPDKAATMMDRLQNRLGPDVLGPEVSQAMEGWNNLFRQSGFAAEQVARSRTGSSFQQIAAPAIALATAGTVPAAFVALAPALMVRSRRFRQLLSKLAEMSPQHPDYQTVTQEVMSELSREAARTQALGTNQ